jgi:hypothetical protein
LVLAFGFDRADAAPIAQIASRDFAGHFDPTQTCSSARYSCSHFVLWLDLETTKDSCSFSEVADFLLPPKGKRHSATVRQFQVHAHQGTCYFIHV